MVEVFKTNVKNTRQSKIVIEQLIQFFPNADINLDLEDNDRVLRFEDIQVNSKRIISLINAQGFRCEILND